MQLCQNMMRCLGVLVLVLTLTITGASAQQDVGPLCCTEVSTQKITVPIRGFLLQRRNLPCVKAVIFFTEEGPKCTHWREEWVLEKIREIKKLQAEERVKRMTVSVPTATSPRA